MLKKYFFISALFFGSSLLGQKNSPEEISFVTSIPKISIGKIEVKDPYLSPFTYKGWHLKTEKQNSRFIGRWRKYTFFNSYSFAGGTALHPTKNNRMLYFDTKITFGGNYHSIPFHNFHIAFGTGAEISLGGKYLARNINNPFSLDLYTGLNGTMNFDYSFRFWIMNCRINYGLQTPLLGAMFVPQQGTTYYEIFSLKNTDNTIHFTSLHNRQAINHFFDFDIRLKKITIRLGINQDYRIYRANNMVFKHNALGVSLGTVFNIYRYFGSQPNREIKLVSTDTFRLTENNK
ncbi:MAG: hypothetical protein CR965_00850 [Paludibacter sp.]|nr:MAG: hypothetical protein CR965_00850 [Paludibacter sp.]